MAELVFWCSVGLALYVYVGYPCALMLVALVKSRSVKKAEKGSAAPLVSFIITAHNEERRIREKIEVDPGEPCHLVTVWGVGYRWDP